MDVVHLMPSFSLTHFVLVSILAASIALFRRSSSQMPSLSVVRAANAAFSPSYPPTAIFVGGTSGIGQAMAETFGNYTQGNGRIIIVGRNRASAESILSKLPPSKIPGAPHEFVQCDLTLMRNVEKATKDLLARVPKVNYLVMSPGIMTMSGRDETEEGIDKKFAVHYYARWKFTRDLIPALERAKDEGEDAKVLSVLAAGITGPIDLNDLGLKKGFTLTQAGLQAPTYNDLMIESFAALYPKLTFIHSAPGIVRTTLMATSPSPLLRATSSLLLGLTYPFSRSPAVCAEWMWYGVWNTAKSRSESPDAKGSTSIPGAWRIGEKGQDVGLTRYFGSEEARKKLWEHTEEAVRVKEA
ncbi:hypothetical protein BDQ12DRAFT_682599 [Crucibulum laeve]|uniref:NAD(P)-binding protein n=1 Tax=Crucibulum laeve TaxID=68775 RepID=A0A5C3M3U3_9AGAR|nr:hypothetical protein BDQ12DRAFT_682599 [Crucibulum laeve]